MEIVWGFGGEESKYWRDEVMFKKQRQLEGTLIGHSLTFELLVEEIRDPRDCVLCENYGLRVTHVTPGGEITVQEIPGITTNGAKITTLFDQIVRLDVTPTTLRDVVDDYIAACEE